LTKEHECVTTCEATFYHSDSPIKQCKSCVSPCELCSSETHCETCLAGHPFLQTDGTCSTPCPSGYYGETSTNSCEPCHSTCRTCTGPNENQCGSCYNTRFLREHYCLDNCPSGMFEKYTCSCAPDNDCGCCKHCHTNCETCYDDTNFDCIVCAAGFHAQPNSDVMCMVNCPSGYYADNESRLCVACSAPCATCSGLGDGSGNCGSC